MTRLRRLLMTITFGALVLGVSLVSVALVAPVSAQASRAVSADLTGAAEVPPLETAASGSFTGTLSGGELSFNLTSDAVGITQAHIHLGAVDDNGGVVAFLFGAVDPGVDGIDVSGTITADDLIGAVEGDMMAFAQALQAGDGYVNVHTEANPAGEVRGQIAVSEPTIGTPTLTTAGVDATAVSLVAGGNLLGWFGVNSTTSEILAGNTDLTTIWVFHATLNAWEADSTLLPDPLRRSLPILRGSGLFIITSAATELMVPTGSTFNTDVFPFSDPTRDLGDATFTRTLDGVTISADADGLIAGNAYTMWWVIWNDPTQCAVVCGESDLGAPGNVILLAGNGLVASEAGTASFTSHLTVGGPMPDGPIPGALTRPIQATIHLVLRDHGPALTGDALIAQLTTFEATADDAASVGDGFGFDVHAAVSDAPNTPLTAAITAVDDSGVSGSATLRASGDGTAIQVTVAGLTEGDHANHVHHGSCAEQGDIHVPLSDLSAGADGDASGATVWPDNGLDHFASSHYVAVHELVTFAVIACGDVS